jgi:hypothetical protein
MRCRMRLILRALGLGLLTAPLVAQGSPTPSKSEAYVPDPKQWKLYVKTPIGGWTTAKELTFEVKVADPKDPHPPEEILIPLAENNPYAYGDYEGEGGGDEMDAAPVRAESERSRSRQAEKWRHIQLQCWVNGVPSHRAYMVGHRIQFHMDVQDGENRIEIREPLSGQRAIRTFWGANSRDRLVIRLTEDDPSPSLYHGGWWWGGLQVVEPDSTESIGGEPTPSGGKNRGKSYHHATPLAGTYTVRWFDTRAGVDGYSYEEYGYASEEVRPRKVICEIVLDPGTDRERRWRFERLVMPGTPRVTLGSFDVED